MLYKIKLLFKTIALLFIFDKNKRNHYRNRLIKFKIDNTKFGASYSLFDGEELLEASIKSIRNSVDYINVVYQTISWNGKSKNENLPKFLSDLKNKGLIDELIYFEPNVAIDASKNEKRKRNLGLKYAKRAKCNYFMTMDVDEFYKKDEIEKTKFEIVKNGITHSFCPIINYGYTPKVRIIDYANYSVPFFSRINFFSLIGKFKNKICLVDPTRQISHFICSKYYYFNTVQMHHMSYVRNNLEAKLKNSSSDILAKMNQDSIIIGPNIEVPDEFNIGELK